MGAVLKLIQYEVAVEDYATQCEIIPREARCAKCRCTTPRWYPQPAPTVRLHLIDETLVIPLVGVPVIHMALYDVLRDDWPEVQVTRCSSHPRSKLKIGERYVSLSVPPRNYVELLYPLGKPEQCILCKRWKNLMGFGAKDPYVAPTPEQYGREVAYISHISNDLLISPHLRESIVRLGIGTIGWLTVPIFSERLPQHIVPDEQVIPRSIAAEEAFIRVGENFSCPWCKRERTRQGFPRHVDVSTWIEVPYRQSNTPPFVCEGCVLHVYNACASSGYENHFDRGVVQRVAAMEGMTETEFRRRCLEHQVTLWEASPQPLAEDNLRAYRNCKALLGAV